MALVTVFFYAKGGFVVMTGSAGFSGFHLCHGNGLVACSRQINPGVAFLALVHADVEFMTEGNVAGVCNFKALLPHGVALGTFTQGKGFLAVMTRTARFPL